MIHQKVRTYRIVFEHKDAWKPESFRERYSEVLDRYDFIVGDWGYNQLRLKGFYRDDHPKATKETRISYLQDYLQEYCNFGCAYFVIERVEPSDRLDPEAAQAQLITITELPSADRYAEWKAFKNKLQEQREQQGDNGEEKNGRHKSRSANHHGHAGGNHGQPGKGRRGQSAARDRQEAGSGHQQASSGHKQSHSGNDREKPQQANRNGQAGHAARRHSDQPGGRRHGDGQAGREAAAVPASSRESQRDAGHKRTAGRNRGGNHQQEQVGAAGHPQEAGKPANKRPWNRNRKNRHSNKWDRPRKSGSGNQNRSGEGAVGKERTTAAEPGRD